MHERLNVSYDFLYFLDIFSIATLIHFEIEKKLFREVTCKEITLGVAPHVQVRIRVPTIFTKLVYSNVY